MTVFAYLESLVEFSEKKAYNELDLVWETAEEVASGAAPQEWDIIIPILEDAVLLVAQGTAPGVILTKVFEIAEPEEKTLLSKVSKEFLKMMLGRLDKQRSGA